MAKINTISTINHSVPGNEYLNMSPVDCLASAKAMHDEIVKQDSRLWVLADMMNDCHDKYQLQDCLDALQIHYGIDNGKLAA